MRFFGLAFCLISACFAQQPGRVVIPVVRSVTISVTSDVAGGCGSTVSPTLAQQDVMAVLRATGFKISNDPYAILAIDADCGAVGVRRRSSPISVHQCLTLSEKAPITSKENGATFTMTWRKCHADQCGGSNCQEMVRFGLHGLLMQLLKTYEEQDPLSDLSMLQSQLPQQPNVKGAAENSNKGAQSISASPFTLSSIRSDGIILREMFYSLYLMNCIGTLVYWLSRASTVDAPFR